MSDDLNPFEHDLQLPGCPGPDPWLGVHPQSPGPGNVLLTPSRTLTPLLRQLLSHGPDVVSLEPATTADVAHSKVVSLSSELVHIKSAQREINNQYYYDVCRQYRIIVDLV